MKKIGKIEELNNSTLRIFVSHNDLPTVLDLEDESVDFKIERWQFTSNKYGRLEQKYVEMDERLFDVF